MRRFIAGIILLLISLLSFSVPAKAGDASLSISGGGAKKIGASFTLTASLNTGGNQICVVTFDITYPANLLTLKSSSLGSPFTMATEQSSSEGNIHYSVGAGGCTTGNATLLTMNFTAKAVGNATVAFSSGEAIGGADGQQIIATSKGSTTVTMAKATTTTTTSNNNANTAPAPAVTLPKDPVLTKLEYALEAVLDDTTKQAKGIIFSGTADADTKINIVIASDPITSSTQSDASGNWTYTMVDWLPAGNHTIAMIAEKNDQKSAEAKTNFVIGTESKDQIAIGTELPAVAVAQPATNTKSKWTISTMMMIAGGIILILIVVLLVIFIKKRRKYLSVAKEISGSIKTNANKLNSNVLPLENSKPNQDLEAPISEPESNVQPLESSGEAVKPNPNVVPDNQPMTMPKDIPLPGEPKIPETTTPQESTQTTITSPPPSIQTSNIKPDSDKMIIGYGPDSGSQKAAESPKAEPAEIVQTPENKTPKVEVSPDSEITFDGDYDSNEVIEQDNVSKKSQ